MDKLKEQLVELIGLAQEIRDALLCDPRKHRKHRTDYTTQPHTKATISTAVADYFQKHQTAYNGLRVGLQRSPEHPKLSREARALFSARAVARAVGAKSHKMITTCAGWRGRAAMLGLLTKLIAVRRSSTPFEVVLDRTAVVESSNETAAGPLDYYSSDDNGETIDRNDELERLIREQKQDDRARRLSQKM